MRHDYHGLPEGWVGQVKCPECGFVSFPQPSECKKCGHRFDRAPASRSGGFTGQVSFRSQDPGAAASIGSSLSSQEHSSELDHAARPDAPPGSESRLAEATLRPAAVDSAEARARAWESEIAERVARYRRRKGGRSEDAEDNLEFDFSGATAGPGDDGVIDGAHPSQDEAIFDDRRESQAEAPLLDSIHIQRGSAAGLRPEDAAEWALEPSDFRIPAPDPVEVSLDEPLADDAPELIAAGRMRLAAPVGVRFTAGILDAVILLISAAVFGFVFVESGGRLTLSRHGQGVANLLILGVLAAFFLMFYFGLFTALSFATPGQAAMGLRVRTLENEPPDGRAARRRALGYLLSTAALMMGFIWAVFDVDGLTWHDRMSSTCLAQQRN